MNSVPDSPLSREHICSELRRGKLAILPGADVYNIYSNMFNTEAIQRLYILKEKNLDEPLALAVLDMSHIEMLCDEDTTGIIERLVDKFWPGELSLILKHRPHLPDSAYTKDGSICVSSPREHSVREVLREIDQPLVYSSANKSGMFASTHISHVKSYFNTVDDLAVLSANSSSSVGIQNTVINITGNSVSLVRLGPITFQEIRECLHTIPGIIYTDKVRSVSPGQGVGGCAIKRSVLANFTAGEVFERSASRDELCRWTNEYLSKSIFVDFGKRNLEKQTLCYGYIDLSENDDIKEAHFNLNNTLFQLHNLASTVDNVIFFNVCKSKKGLYRTLYDKLLTITNNREILIPIMYTGTCTH
tara:strand:+ start:1608 stop:2687 length:1080 start_codon:yes stop_codon:yes gene_type:complete